MHELEDTLRALATALLVASLVTPRSVRWWLVREPAVLSPLQHVSRASSHIARGALGTRLRADGDRDLEPLVESFNSMADALQRRIEREARFSSDVSHDCARRWTASGHRRSGARSREEDLPPRTRAAIDVLENQSRTSSASCSTSSRISRYDAGANTLSLEPVDLESFVRDTVSAIDTAPSARSRAPRADAHRQASRRAHARQPGRERTCARGGLRDVTIDATSDYVEIALADEGAGIRDSERSLIFERFWRGSSTRHSGLAVPAWAGARRRTRRLHGGSVRVEPTVPNGSTFILRLPATWWRVRSNAWHVLLVLGLGSVRRARGLWRR